MPDGDEVAGGFAPRPVPPASACVPRRWPEPPAGGSRTMRVPGNAPCRRSVLAFPTWCRFARSGVWPRPGRWSRAGTQAGWNSLAAISRLQVLRVTASEEHRNNPPHARSRENPGPGTLRCRFSKPDVEPKDRAFAVYRSRRRAGPARHQTAQGTGNTVAPYGSKLNRVPATGAESGPPIPMVLGR